MVASQVVISPKKAGKGDNLWWPESKAEKYKGRGRGNGYLTGRGNGLEQSSLRCAERGGQARGDSFGSQKGREWRGERGVQGGRTGLKPSLSFILDATS